MSFYIDKQYFEQPLFGFLQPKLTLLGGLTVVFLNTKIKKEYKFMEKATLYRGIKVILIPFGYRSLKNKSLF